MTTEIVDDDELGVSIIDDEALESPPTPVVGDYLAPNLSWSIATLRGGDVVESAQRLEMAFSQGELAPGDYQDLVLDAEDEELASTEGAVQILLRDPSLEPATLNNALTAALTPSKVRDSINEMLVTQLEGQREQVRRGRGDAFAAGASEAAPWVKAKAFESMREMTEAAGAKGSASTMSATIDFLNSALVTDLSFQMYNVMKDLGDPKATYTPLNVGQLYRDVRTRYARSTPQEMIALTRKILDAIEANRGLFSADSDFDRYMLLHTLIPTGMESADEIDMNALFEQGVNLLDAAFLGTVGKGLAMGAMKLGRGVKSFSNLSKVINLDPENAQFLAMELGFGNGKVARATQTTREENAITNLLPKAGDVQQLSVNILDYLLPLLNDKPDIARRFEMIMNQYNRVYTGLDRVTSQVRTAQALNRRIGRVGGVAHPEKTSVLGAALEEGKDGFRIRTVIGKDDVNGYELVEALSVLRHSDEFQGLDLAHVTLLYKNDETGDLIAMTAEEALRRFQQKLIPESILSPTGATAKALNKTIIRDVFDSKDILEKVQPLFAELGKAASSGRTGTKAQAKRVARMNRIMDDLGFDDGLKTVIWEAMERSGFEQIPDVLYAAIGIVPKYSKKVTKTTVTDRTPVRGTGTKELAVGADDVAKILKDKAPKKTDDFVRETVLELRDALVAIREALSLGKGSTIALDDLRLAAKAFGIKHVTRKRADIEADVLKALNIATKDDAAMAKAIDEYIVQVNNGEFGRTADGKAIIDPGVEPEFTEVSRIVKHIEEQVKLEHGTVTRERMMEHLNRFSELRESLIFRPADPSKSHEFFIGVELDHLYNPRDITKFLPSDVTGFGGKIARLLPAASQFAKRIVTAQVRADQTTATVARDLKNILKPFASLDPRGKHRVAALLDDGDRNGYWLAGDQLAAALDFNQKQIKAYNSVRQLSTVLYWENTYRMYLGLTSKGYNRVLQTDNFWGPVKVYNGDRSNIKTILDPDTGEIIPFRTAGLKEGDVILQSRWAHSKAPATARPDGAELEQTSFVLQRNHNLQPLPLNVLKQRPGYVPLGYDAGYLVKRKVRIIDNGTPEEVDVTVRIAGSRGEAEGYIAMSGDDRMFPELAVEASGRDYVNGSNIDFFKDNGMLFFQERAASEILPVRGKRAVLEIADRLEMGAAVAAKQMGVGRYVEGEKQRWLNTYKGILGKGVKGIDDTTFPAEAVVRDIKFRVPSERAEWKEAAANYYRIRMMERQNDSVAFKAWQSWMLGLSDSISTPSQGLIANARNTLAGAVLPGQTIAPIEWVKTLAFIDLIVNNPLTQVFLQAQAATVYMGMARGTTYYADATAKGFAAEWKALGRGMAGRTLGTWDKTAAQTAKAMGMTVEEYTKFVDDFMDSGLLQTIDSHDFLGGFARGDFGATAGSIADTSTLGNLMLQGAALPGQALRGAVTIAKKVGFNAGEASNMMAAYLTARRRWMLDNPGKQIDADALADIAGDASNMAQNMSAGDRMAWQQGGLSAALQFWSIQLKMTQTLMRGVPFAGKTGLANQTFAVEEARRIALYQLFMYGTPGLGAVGLYHLARDASGWTPSQTINDAFEGGMFEMGLNFALGVLFEEGGRVEFSQRFAPASGPAAVVENIAKALALLGNSPSESIGKLLGGASTTVVGRAMEFARTGRLILGHSDYDTPEKIAKIIPELLEAVSGGYSQYTRARLAMRFGEMSSTAGDPIVKATFAEAMFKALGVQSKAEADVQELLFDVARSSNITGGPSALDEQAEKWANAAQELARKYSEDDDWTPEYFNNLLEISTVLVEMTTFDASEKAYLVGRMNEILNRDLTENRAESALTRIGEGFSKGWLTNPKQMITRLKNTEGLDPKQKAEMIHWLENLVTNTPTQEQLHGLIQ